MPSFAYKAHTGLSCISNEEKYHPHEIHAYTKQPWLYFSNTTPTIGTLPFEQHDPTLLNTAVQTTHKKIQNDKRSRRAQPLLASHIFLYQDQNGRNICSTQCDQGVTILKVNTATSMCLNLHYSADSAQELVNCTIEQDELEHTLFFLFYSDHDNDKELAQIVSILASNQHNLDEKINQICNKHIKKHTHSFIAIPATQIQSQANALHSFSLIKNDPENYHGDIVSFHHELCNTLNPNNNIKSLNPFNTYPCQQRSHLYHEQQAREFFLNELGPQKKLAFHLTEYAPPLPKVMHELTEAYRHGSTRTSILEQLAQQCIVPANPADFNDEHYHNQLFEFCFNHRRDLTFLMGIERYSWLTSLITKQEKLTPNDTSGLVSAMRYKKEPDLHKFIVLAWADHQTPLSLSQRKKQFSYHSARKKLRMCCALSCIVFNSMILTFSGLLFYANTQSEQPKLSIQLFYTLLGALMLVAANALILMNTVCSEDHFTYTKCIRAESRFFNKVNENKRPSAVSRNNQPLLQV